MRPALVIFDCDGVLVDSEPIALRLRVRALAALGWSLTEAEVVERFVGRSDADVRAIIERQLGRELPGGWEADYEERQRAALRRELRAVAGVAAALARIEAPVCVASSGTPEKMRLTLGLTGLLERFDGRLFSATEVARGKPAPDLFLHAARRMSAAPSECVVVEDSVHGVLAARAAGMRCLAYAGGGITPAARLAGPRTVVFERMSELPDLIAAEPA